jgi:hypothetical protein
MFAFVLHFSYDLSSAPHSHLPNQSPESITRINHHNHSKQLSILLPSYKNGEFLLEHDFELLRGVFAYHPALNTPGSKSKSKKSKSKKKLLKQNKQNPDGSQTEQTVTSNINITCLDDVDKIGVNSHDLYPNQRCFFLAKRKEEKKEEKEESQNGEKLLNEDEDEDFDEDFYDASKYDVLQISYARSVDSIPIPDDDIRRGAERLIVRTAIKEYDTYCTEVY